jgi:HK97 family phage prohead protease
MRTMEYKGAITEIKNLSAMGEVTFYASVFGNKDYGGDIVERGAFSKTITENNKNIRHFKHHDSTQMVGVVKSLIEDDKGLLVTSKLILKTQLGAETYEEYKAMLEAGKSMDHSIGYNVIKKEDRNDSRLLKELRLMEVSTLTAWGMNNQAQTVAVKSFEQLDLNELLTEEKYYKALLNCKFTDAKLDNIQGLYDYLKSLITERAAESTQGDEPIVIKGSDYIKTLNFKF